MQLTLTFNQSFTATPLYAFTMCFLKTRMYRYTFHSTFGSCHYFAADPPHSSVDTTPYSQVGLGQKTVLSQISTGTVPTGEGKIVPGTVTELHAMQTYGAVAVQFHVFLTSALDRGEWLVSGSDRFMPDERTPVHSLDRSGNRIQ